MIRILYFARFREKLNCESEELQPESGSMSVRMLVQQLGQRGETWSEVFDSGQRILVSINQEIVNFDAEIKDNDEVAFFPPITGG